MTCPWCEQRPATLRVTLCATGQLQPIDAVNVCVECLKDVRLRPERIYDDKSHERPGAI